MENKKVKIQRLDGRYYEGRSACGLQMWGYTGKEFDESEPFLKTLSENKEYKIIKL